MSLLALPPEIIQEIAKNFIYGDDYKAFGLTCKFIYWAIKNRAKPGQFQIYYGSAEGMPFLFVDENDYRIQITEFCKFKNISCKNFKYFDIYPFSATFGVIPDININFTTKGLKIFDIEIRNFDRRRTGLMRVYIFTRYSLK